jgi:hypothetical protein
MKQLDLDLNLLEPTIEEVFEACKRDAPDGIIALSPTYARWMLKSWEKDNAENNTENKNS